jgi:hypothetical protein
LAGRGADLFVIDDPHSEQDMKANSRLAFDNAWSWFQTGPLQRLMPGGAIIVIMTSWSLLDLTWRLIDYQIKNPETYLGKLYSCQPSWMRARIKRNRFGLRSGT